MRDFSQKFAFTMAEVLVTMGIIGVVAVLTMPALINNHRNQVYITQLKKVYSELSQAALSAINTANALSLVESRAVAEPLSFLERQFKVSKSCNTSSATSCLAASYKNINGDAVANTLAQNTVCAIVNGGATICLQPSLGSLNVLFDTNGPANPNTIGKDVFYLRLNNQGDLIANYIQKASAPTGKSDSNDRSADVSIVSDFNTKIEEQQQKQQHAAGSVAACKASTALMSSDTGACFKQIEDSNWKIEY